MADLHLGLITGMSITVHLESRPQHAGGCTPDDLRAIARTLRIIADTVERGRRPRTAKAPVALKTAIGRG